MRRRPPCSFPGPTKRVDGGGIAGSGRVPLRSRILRCSPEGTRGCDRRRLRRTVRQAVSPERETAGVPLAVCRIGRRRHGVLQDPGERKGGDGKAVHHGGCRPWRRDQPVQEVRSAIVLHNKTTHGDRRIAAGASAYSFRHARISELLHVYGVDPLTVAAQTGTSLRMIEHTYFKVIRSAVIEKLAGLKAKATTQ